MRVPDYALSPLTWALLLTLILIFWWRRLPIAVRCAGIFIEVLLLLLMAPVGANLLVLAVESQTPVARSCATPEPTTVVVLSGGTYRLPRSPEDYAALEATSLRRLFSGIVLWRQAGAERLVIAGGGRVVPESVLLANLAMSMGVPSSAVEVEGRSHTTWENALNVAKLTPKVPQRIWLVTSALHMPRALGAFRAWGFDPCAWPSESLYRSFYPSPGYFIPQQSSLEKAGMAIHEIVGGLVYRGLEWKLRKKQSASSANGGEPAPASTG